VSINSEEVQITRKECRLGGRGRIQ